MIYNTQTAKNIVCPYQITSPSPKPCQTHHCALWRWATGEEIKSDELNFNVYEQNHGFCGLGVVPVNSYKQP